MTVTVTVTVTVIDATAAPPEGPGGPRTTLRHLAGYPVTVTVTGHGHGHGHGVFILAP